MTVLSTLQDYIQPLADQLHESHVLEQIVKNKWSILGASVALYVIHQYASRPR